MDNAVNEYLNDLRYLETKIRDFAIKYSHIMSDSSNMALGKMMRDLFSIGANTSKSVIAKQAKAVRDQIENSDMKARACIDEV